MTKTTRRLGSPRRSVLLEGKRGGREDVAVEVRDPLMGKIPHTAVLIMALGVRCRRATGSGRRIVLINFKTCRESDDIGAPGIPVLNPMRSGTSRISVGST